MLTFRSRILGRVLTAGLVLLLASACGEEGTTQPDTVEWRNLSIDLPEAWYLFEEEETRLSISNENLGTDADREPGERPEGDVVAMFFTYEPQAVPQDWRRFVEERGAELETDTQLELQGQVPATQLVFSHVNEGVPTREMAVVIPSRGVVVLAQPVPGPGGGDTAQQVFLEHLETFMEVIESIEFGAPVMD